MGCSARAAYDFYQDRGHLSKKVKDVKIFDEMIEEYRELKEKRDELLGFIQTSPVSYTSKQCLYQIEKLWDALHRDTSEITQKEVEEKTLELLRKRKLAQSESKELRGKMSEIEKRFNEMVGNNGAAGIGDLI